MHGDHLRRSTTTSLSRAAATPHWRQACDNLEDAGRHSDEHVAEHVQAIIRACAPSIHALRVTSTDDKRNFVYRQLHKYSY